MKKIGILAAALVFALPPLAAQTPGGRIHRTEVAPYRNRDEAETRTRGKDDAAYMVFAPEVFLSDGRSVSAGQVLDIPGAISTCSTSGASPTSPSRSCPTPRSASACCGSTSRPATPATTKRP